LEWRYAVPTSGNNDAGTKPAVKAVKMGVLVGRSFFLGRFAFPGRPVEIVIAFGVAHWRLIS
jgi:hypothetical protein